MKRRTWEALRPWHCLTIAVLLIPGCRSKDGRYFVPNPFGPPIDVTDLVAPTIENIRPSNSNIFLNDDGFSFDVFDRAGSGVDYSRVRAVLSGQNLPLTRGAGNTWNADITSIADGRRVTVDLEAYDSAANRRTDSVTFTRDISGSTVTFIGPTNGSSNQPTASINIRGTYADPSGITEALYFVRQPVNGQCLATGNLYPIGSGPGTVSQNRYDLGLSGIYDLNLVLNAPSGPLPQMVTYCWHFHSKDGARGRNGDARPNPTDRSWRVDYNWLQPAPNPQVHSVAVTPNNISLTHPATQQMTATVNADPGASTSVTWTATSTSVGTINQSGLVTTVGAGQLDIQACSTVAPTVCGTARISVLPTPFNFSVAFSLVSWNHTPYLGGPSNTCGRGQATVTQGMQSALAGSPYTVSWTGPGIFGSSTRSGTLDANGQFFDRQAIASFGTYTVNVSVTSGGITRTATGTTTVNSSPGSCPPP